MTDAPAQSENVTVFLSENAGIYRYRTWFSRTMFCFGIVTILAASIGVYELFLGEQNSIYETIRFYVFLACSPFLTWSCFVVARSFREIRIDSEGISILPFGLRFRPHDLEDVEHSQNYARAGTIRLKLKSPYLILHIAAWSLGRTVTIAFNDRILTRFSAST